MQRSVSVIESSLTPNINLTWMTSFSDIFWIDASSESNIDLRFKQIAKAYNVPSESVLQWIAGKNDWLLVYDNADCGYQMVERFLPQGNKGNIIITSRNKAFGRLTTSENSLEVDNMGEEEAISLLLRSAMPGSDFLQSTAKEIVRTLGFIPLAIDQAGAYVQSCGCSLDNYLELFLRCRERLMSESSFKGASNYGYSTYGTWEISMQEIEQKALNPLDPGRIAAQDALSLQRFFAFLHHENISEEMFMNAAVNYQKINKEKESDLPCLISSLSSRELFLCIEGEWDKPQFLGGIQILLSFSLIKWNQIYYSVHPLVQAWCRDRLSEAEAARNCLRTRALLSCSVDVDFGKDNYASCIQLVPHIRDSYGFSMQLNVENSCYDDECMRFGFALDRSGNWEEAERFHLQAMNHRKIKLRADHPDTLSSMANLASTYWNQGRWQEAENLEVHVMEASKEKLGADHPNTLSSMANLASTYWNQGRWQEAENLEVHVMEARKEKLGADHPDTLTSMANLASTYRNQGRWQEAENLEVHVMEARKERFGAEHPDTLMAMANLALTYRNQGR